MLAATSDLGIVAFVLLFIISSWHYPGGSFIDSDNVGFDWIYNYWCNLFNEQTINGEINKARTYAIIGHISLCVSLSCFFYSFLDF